MAAISPTKQPHQQWAFLWGRPFITSSISLLMDLFELLIHYWLNLIVRVYLQICPFLQCFQFLRMVSCSGCLGGFVPSFSLTIRYLLVDCDGHDKSLSGLPCTSIHLVKYIIFLYCAHFQWTCFLPFLWGHTGPLGKCWLGSVVSFPGEMKMYGLVFAK